MNNQSESTKNQVSTTATRSVIKNISSDYPFKNRMPIVVSEKSVKASRSIIADMLHLTQNELPISRLEGMHENAMLKGLILSKNGRNSNEVTDTDVLFVGSERSSRKTISSLYPKTEQTTLRIFNHFAGRATVENGKLYNIYQNSELLK